MTSRLILKSAGNVYKVENDWHYAKAQLQEAANGTLVCCKMILQGCGSFALV